MPSTTRDVISKNFADRVGRREIAAIDLFYSAFDSANLIALT